MCPCGNEDKKVFVQVINSSKLFCLMCHKQKSKIDSKFKYNVQKKLKEHLNHTTDFDEGIIQVEDLY